MEKENLGTIVRNQYEAITKKLIGKKLTVTTMESCTSGLVASLITDTEGASAVLKGAFITYSNEAKIMQGVPEKTIEQFGVYSTETASAMAKACRKAYKADIGIGITGTFGNLDPNNPDSVEGRVFFAIETEAETKTFMRDLSHQPSRLCYKMVIAKEIADELEKII